MLGKESKKDFSDLKYYPNGYEGDLHLKEVYNFGSNRISYIEMEKILSDAVSSFKQLVKELDE